ncbi:MAG: ABC-2 family transporter protein [Firmicutes bacterium]|nr:ABC-2 family transporter protein [Bacillota bacterium]
MADKIRRLLCLYKLYARMDLQWFMQDKFTCALCIASDLLGSVASISGVFLLSQRFAGVAGLSADEALFFLGFFTLADGLNAMLFASNNVLHISRRVGRGQVDHMLIQPVPLWMQLLAEGFMPVSGNSGFLCGLALTIVSITRLGLAVTPAWLLLLLACLLLRMAVVTGWAYLAGASAFYKPAACEEISSLAIDVFSGLGKYPLSGLPSWLAGLLFTAVPVGLMAWLPAHILLGKMDAPVTLLLPVIIAAALLSAATYAFQKGLRHYVKFGCGRYRDLGHRN